VATGSKTKKLYTSLPTYVSRPALNEQCVSVRERSGTLDCWLFVSGQSHLFRQQSSSIGALYVAGQLTFRAHTLPQIRLSCPTPVESGQPITYFLASNGHVVEGLGTPTPKANSYHSNGPLWCGAQDTCAQCPLSAVLQPPVRQQGRLGVSDHDRSERGRERGARTIGDTDGAGSVSLICVVVPVMTCRW